MNVRFWFKRMLFSYEWEKIVYKYSKYWSDVTVLPVWGKANDWTFYLCIWNDFAFFCLLFSSNNSQVLRLLPLNHTSFSAMSWCDALNVHSPHNKSIKVLDEYWWNFRSKMSSVISHQPFGNRSNRIYRN